MRKKSAQDALSFFFIRFDDVCSLDCGVILRSLLCQALSGVSIDDSILALMNKSESCLFDTESLLETFHRTATVVRDFYLVLDGLEECTANEQHSILDFFSGLLLKCQRLKVKILISGRDSILDAVDGSLPSTLRLTVGLADTNLDLMRFAQEILRDTQRRGYWDVEDKTLIDEILSLGGEGM